MREPDGCVAPDPLALASEMQRMRLELEEARDEVGRLQEELERRRSQEAARVADAVSGLQRELMAQVAAPAAQLLTQAHLLEVEGRTVSTRDVLAVARRMVRALVDAGLTVEGQAGEAVVFDATRHEPLGEFCPAPGEAATLRVAGVSFQGERLRRGGVVAP